MKCVKCLHAMVEKRKSANGQFTSHVLGASSIIKKIVVAYRDYYYDPAGEYLEDWDSFGKNQFDRAAKSLNRKFNSVPPKVLSVAADGVNGFTLNMGRSFRLDVFPDNSLESGNPELWRLFEPSSGKKHFVVP